MVTAGSVFEIAQSLAMGGSKTILIGTTSLLTMLLSFIDGIGSSFARGVAYLVDKLDKVCEVIEEVSNGIVDALVGVGQAIGKACNAVSSWFRSWF